jgi:hypothetical protein
MRLKHRKKRVTPNNQTPDWLRSIQLNSWEAELLVSALLLYVLFQVPESLDLYFRRVIEPGNVLSMLANIMIKGIKLIRLGYSLHILIRGIWVATVGLSYVFPDGLSRERLRFKGRFDKELENHEKLDGFVLTLERLASTIYGISFMLFGIYLGAFSLLFIVVLVGEYGVARAFQQDNTWLALLSTAFILIYIGAILILLVDFITNGLLRRDRSTAKWFYYVAVTFRVITFSILYRRSMLVILSNLPTWWRRVLPFMLVLIVFSYWYAGELKTGYDIDRYYEKPEGHILPENYESQRSYGDVTRVTIPEFVINGEVIEVFLRDIGNLGRTYKAQPDIDYRARWDEIPPLEKSEFLQKLIKVDIDSAYFLKTEWLDSKNKYDYSQGFYGYLNVSDIPDGLHNLNLRLDRALIDSLWDSRSAPEMQMHLGNIPFYLDKP